MLNLRRALILASGGRYAVMMITFLSTIIVARLLTPAEFGISVLGASVLGIADAIRELGSISYLVQEKELTRQKTRTVFTISFIVTLTVTILLIMLSGFLGKFYAVPKLTQYIRVVAISYAIAPFAHPVYAMLSRDMAFGKLAILDVVTTLANAIASVCLVSLGFSYMGLAWAWVISSALWTLLGFYVMRDFSIYRLSLAEWRSVLSFGAYGSARAVLYRISESLFYLILGKLLDARAVGLCQRAFLLAKFPERVILAGIGAVALPAFSEHARRGHDLKRAYLDAVEHVSVVLWPALILLGMLAGPVVSLLLGPQWHDTVPIVQIFATALLVNFPSNLNYPILVAAGSIRRTVSLAFVQTTVSLAVMCFAALYGLWAVALSTLFTNSFSMALAAWFVQSVVSFRWRELAGALRKSAMSSAMSAVGPAIIVFGYSGSATMPLGIVAAAVVLCGIGWIGGLWLTRHPLFRELCRAHASVAVLLATQRGILSRISARLRLGV